MTDDTTRVLFIIDALEPVTDDDIVKAADKLASILKQLSPDVHTTYRILGAPKASS